MPGTQRLRLHLFLVVIEEAIYDSPHRATTATTVTGCGHTVEALPLEALQILRAHSSFMRRFFIETASALEASTAANSGGLSLPALDSAQKFFCGLSGILCGKVLVQN
jgi:hypothetical protein